MTDVSSLPLSADPAESSSADASRFEEVVAELFSPVEPEAALFSVVEPEGSLVELFSLVEPEGSLAGSFLLVELKAPVALFWLVELEADGVGEGEWFAIAC